MWWKKRRFFGDNEDNPKIDESIELLRRLTREDSFDTARRVYAEATYINMEQAYIEGRGVTRSQAKVCIRWLTGGRCGEFKSPDYYCGDCHPPGMDHPSLWNKGGKPYSYVFQPYGLDNETLEELMAYCEKHGLSCSVNSESWHFPGGTLIVELRRKTISQKLYQLQKGFDSDKKGRT